mmetsp:Transcript_117149/g.343177  ORF Transcript_117149/g.343177 Transcript_117149/m.343177 type:complete len:224 (+) Transcript_117149:736-1407(+)
MVLGVARLLHLSPCRYFTSSLSGFVTTPAATSDSKTLAFMRQHRSRKPRCCPLSANAFRWRAADGSTRSTRAKLRMQYLARSLAAAVESSATSLRTEPKKRWPCKYSIRMRSPSFLSVRISQNGRFIRLTTRLPTTTLITGEVPPLWTRKRAMLRAMLVAMAVVGVKKTDTMIPHRVMAYCGDGSHTLCFHRTYGRDLYESRASLRKWKAVFMKSPLKNHLGT